MDGEAGWWTTSGNIRLPPLARVMGVGRQQQLYKQKKRSPTPENIKNYKKYKNTNLSKQRKAERDYYHEQFEIHKYDLRNSWKIIKEMIGKVDQCKVKKHTTFLINNNQYSSDTKIISNQFNEFFTNVGNSLAKNIKTNIDP